MINDKIRFIIPIGIILVSILFYLFQESGLLTFHDNFTLSKYLFGNIYQGVSGSDVSFGDKVYYLQEGTTDALTIALIAGGILMVWQSFRNERMYLAIVALLALSFLIYFLPEGFFLRSRFLIPFGSLVIAGAANAIIVLCENRFKRIAKFHGKISYVRLFSIIIVLLIFIPLLYDSTNPFKDKLDEYAKRNQVFATFGTSEYDAGKWLRENMPRNTMILSDPYTIILMKELSDLKSPYRTVWIEPNEYPIESLRVMSDIRAKFFLDENNDERKAFLNRLMIDNNASSAIIIINFRTVKFSDSDQFFIVSYSGMRDVQIPIAESLINQFPAKLVYTDQKTIYMYAYNLSS